MTRLRAVKKSSASIDDQSSSERGVSLYYAY